MVYEWQDVDFLYHFVKIYKPNSILELGSGHSTVAMGKALFENGSGFLHSLESEVEYVIQTKAMLDKRFPVKVIYSDIRDQEGAWLYSPKSEAMPKHLTIPNDYDLIYVDGPAYADKGESTAIPWNYRYLIIDGRKHTVEGQLSDNNQPLSVFIK
jgi:predicted O-methyltransferase YrrM